jgi:membrane protease YdiL (CAAX protease family)
MTESRKPPSNPSPTWVQFALGGVIGAAVSYFLFVVLSSGDDTPGWRQPLTFLLAAALIIGLPLNSLATRRALKGGLSPAAMSRPTTYLATAILWILLGLGSVAAASHPDWWPKIAPLDAPWTAAVAIAAGAGLSAVAALLWWARDVDTNRRKRDYLLGFYAQGTDLIAPRTRGEVVAFRAAIIPSSAGEELAYRLLLMNLLALHLGAPAALLLSSIVFAFAHLYQGWKAAAAVGGFGVAAGLLTLASGSIWPAILFHVAWNQAAAGILFRLYREGRA